jgi:hypothetical protein
MLTEYINHAGKVQIYSAPRHVKPEQIINELSQRIRHDFSYTTALNRSDIRANGMLELIPEDIDFRSKRIIFVKR